MVKGISSIIVILFHCRISGIIGDGIIYALRFPIPIFLMSTGFYLYGKNDYMNRAKVFSKYLLLAETIACISLICSSLIESQSFGIDRIIDRLFNSFNLKTLLFGSIFNGTLWYIYSMAWVFVLLHFASKTKKCFEIGYCLAPLLLIIHIVGRVYVTKYYNIEELVYLFRSAVLFSIPFVLIGRFIAEKQYVIKSHLKSYHIGVIFLIGIALLFFEYFRWHQFMDLQISTIFISISIFLFTLWKPEFMLFGIFRYIGKNLLLFVYILHIPVYNIVNALFQKIGIENTNFTTATVIVMTLFVSYVCFSLVKLRKER